VRFIRQIARLHLLKQPVKSLSFVANLFELLLDGVCRNGGVMLSAELASDFRQEASGFIPGQIHCDLARVDDSARIIFAF